MKLFLIVVLAVGFLLVGGLSFIIYDNDSNIESDGLEININYTPSQNLAISEGRFEDAMKSIQEDRSKW